MKITVWKSENDKIRCYRFLVDSKNLVSQYIIVYGRKRVRIPRLLSRAVWMKTLNPFIKVVEEADPTEEVCYIGVPDDFI